MAAGLTVPGRRADVFCNSTTSQVQAGDMAGCCLIMTKPLNRPALLPRQVAFGRFLGDQAGRSISRSSTAWLVMKQEVADAPVCQSFAVRAAR